MMKPVYFVVVILLFWTACDQHTVGYLVTRNAIYVPDTVVFKAVLDPDDPDDARRIRFEIPWQSTTMEGVQGTMPVRYAIYRVDCNNGKEAEALGQFRTSGKGVVELPFDHTLPEGRYVINLKVENEGHKHFLDSLLTVIIR